jgi:hypothetical protein
MNEIHTGDAPEGAEPPQPVLTPDELAQATAANPDDAVAPRHPIEHVLLIDGDNDPHVPTDVKPTRHWLVRVFLRPGAKMPRTLEKKLGHLPHCATVVSPKGGANAADFVMSLHAGMLHAVLPQHIPFLMVTNDATLQAMAAELQRLGRIASLWTSHPDAAQMSQAAQDENDEEPRPRSRSRSRGGRSRGGRSGGRSRGGRSSGRSGRSEEPSAPPVPRARASRRARMCSASSRRPRPCPTSPASPAARPSPRWPGPTPRACSASRTCPRA